MVFRSAEAANEGVPPDVGIRYQSPMTGIQAAVSQFSAPVVFDSSLQHAPVDANLAIPQPQQHNAPGSNQRHQRKTERRTQAIRQEGRMTIQDYQSRRHQIGRLLVKHARVAKAAMYVTNVDYFSGGQRPQTFVVPAHGQTLDLTQRWVLQDIPDRTEGQGSSASTNREGVSADASGIAPQPAPQRQPVHVGRAQTAGRAAVLRSARRASSPIRLREPLILRPRVTASEQVRLLPAANWSEYTPNEYREAFPKAGETRPKARSKASSQRPAKVPRHRSPSRVRATSQSATGRAAPSAPTHTAVLTVGLERGRMLTRIETVADRPPSMASV